MYPLLRFRAPGLPCRLRTSLRLRAQGLRPTAILFRVEVNGASGPGIFKGLGLKSWVPVGCCILEDVMARFGLGIRIAEAQPRHRRAHRHMPWLMGGTVGGVVNARLRSGP